MNLPDFAIRRPVTTLMVCLIAILLGAISFVEIPVDLMPEIVFPTLSVQATYEGVAPEEMETLVTRPLGGSFRFRARGEGDHFQFQRGTGFHSSGIQLRRRISTKRQMNSAPVSTGCGLLCRRRWTRRSSSNSTFHSFRSCSSRSPPTTWTRRNCAISSRRICSTVSSASEAWRR